MLSISALLSAVENAANQWAGVFPYGLDTIRDLVESLETDLPF